MCRVRVRVGVRRVRVRVRVRFRVVRLLIGLGERLVGELLCGLRERRARTCAVRVVDVFVCMRLSVKRLNFL